MRLSEFNVPLKSRWNFLVESCPHGGFGLSLLFTRYSDLRLVRSWPVYRVWNAETS
jgi:hypothetical protein